MSRLKFASIIETKFKLQWNDVPAGRVVTGMPFVGLSGPVPSQHAYSAGVRGSFDLHLSLDVDAKWSYHSVPKTAPFYGSSYMILHYS